MPVSLKKAVDHLRAADPRMGLLIERVGPCRIAYRLPDFWVLVRSIVFQQLNGKAAGAIFGRLERACGPLGMTPETILALRPDRMRRLGLSAQKTAYIRDLARRTRAGLIEFDALGAAEDDAVIETLTQVKGVGEWTAHMFLIFALRRPDVLPVGDYGVRVAMQRLYGLAEAPKPLEMARLAEPWRPWRSIASWYLWRSLDGEAEM